MAQRMMSTAIAPFAGSEISVFSSCAVALLSTASDSFCMSGMEPKFEHTFMVFSNLVRSPADHPRKKALQPIPQGKGLALELELELTAMERRKVDSEKREGVAMRWARRCSRPLTTRASSPFIQCPTRLCCRPPPRKNRRRRRLARTSAWRSPPATSIATTATTMRRMAQLTSTRSSFHRSLSASPCPGLHQALRRGADGVQAQEQHRLLLEGDGEADERQAVHQIKIGYMVTFKLLTPDTLKVIIFDDEGIEVVNKCGNHDEAFATKD
ncbi:hypothetical protein VPH35_017391 [Triticum aestivum]